MGLYKRSKEPDAEWWFKFQWRKQTYAEPTGTAVRRDAEAIERKRRLEITGGQPDDRRGRRQAFLVDMFAAELDEAEAKGLSKGYVDAIKTYHKHLTEFFGGDATLSLVNYDSVRKYERWRRAQKTRSGDYIRGQSIAEEIGCLKRAFLTARRRKLIPAVPDKDSWPVIRTDKKDERRRAKRVSLDVLRAILEQMDPDMRQEFEFAALTGLRREEIARVRWEWIIDGVLYVPEDARKAGGDLAIPLAAPALRACEARREIHGDGPLFPKRDLRKRRAKAIEAANAPWVTFRDLRATYASLVAAKAGMLAARDALGHATTEMTDEYAEATLEERRKAAFAVAADMTGKKKRGKR